MKILLAIDDSDCSAAATKAVIAQFAPQHAEVHVLHADEWPKGLPMSMSFAEGSPAANSILSLHELRRQEAASLVAGAAQQLRSAGFATSTSVRDGDARQVILDCAAEWHADLVVLGSHGKKGFDRLVLGSVSDRVARHAPCSVEIVRDRSNSA
jgi:nucleotide-binding universal stress UspA family protein